MNNDIRHIVINTTAGAADLVVADQMTSLTTNRLGRYLDYAPGCTVRRAAVAAETLGIVTITPTVLTNSTVYEFQLTQLVPGATGSDPKFIQRVISITTPATGVITAITICDQFKNEYFSLQSLFNVTTNPLLAGTLIITAAAGSPVVFADFMAGNGFIAANIVNTTPGVDTFGLPADLQALGVPAAQTTGTRYTLFSVCNNQHVGYSNRTMENHLEIIYIWLDEAMANYAALNTRMVEWTQGLPAGGGAAVDDELIAIDS